jgi:hypothetical protein
MLKKSLIFGSAALFIAALITLTGCPTSVDDSSSGAGYTHRIYGTAVSPYTAQEAINRAVNAGEAIVLEDGLTITPAGHLNFKTARVRIDGAVTFTGGVVSVVDAAVEWGDGAFLTLTGGAYLHRFGTDTSKVTVGTPVEFAESLETIMPTATKAAVKRFKLGPNQNYDYSTSSGGVDAKVKARSLADLYILDELIISSDAAVPTIITAMGTVDIAGTPPAAVVVGTTAATGGVVLGTCSTLTSSKGGVIVTVPGAATLSNVEVQEGKDFTVTQAAVAGAFSIPGKLKGKGTLEISTAPTGTLTIAGGDGNIRFSATTHTATGLTIGSTGTVIFDNDLTTLTADSAIAGNVVFKGNVSTTKSLVLKGNVTLVNGKALTFTPGTLATDALTLGPDKTISVQIIPTAAGSATTTAPVLAAGPAGVVLLGDTTGGATLTAAAAPSRADEKSVNDAKKITLGTQNLKIADGTLQVAAGAIFEIDSKSLITGIDGVNAKIGYLAVADGGTLSLLANAGTKLNIGNGDTVISSTTASTLKAGGGTVTLGANKIAGDTADTKLTAATGGSAPLFTLDALKLLTLQQVDLNLAAHGGLVITTGATPARVILTDKAKITLNNGEGGKETDRTKIAQGGNSVTLTGDLVGLTAPSASTTQAVWSVAHNGGSDVNIISGTATVTLSKSGTSFAQ